MHIVHVHIKVKEEFIGEFIIATKENAEKSIKERGVIRFDLLQREDQKDEFLLTEIYLNTQGSLEHKKTDHYLTWRKTVAVMMEKPRESKKYHEIFPINVKSWKSSNEN